MMDCCSDLCDGNGFVCEKNILIHEFNAAKKIVYTCVHENYQY